MLIDTSNGRSESKKVTTRYLLWLGGLSGSLAGDAAMLFALGWVAAGFGGRAAGLVLTAVVLPRVILLLLGGAVSDRYGARKVMVRCDALMLVFTLAAAALVAGWGAPSWSLVSIAVFFGVVNAFYSPASGSMPRLLVPEPAVPRALSMRQTISNLVGFVGPPLGGVLLALGGLAAVLLFNSLTFFLMLLVLLWAVRTPVHTEEREPVRLLASLRDGLALARADGMLLSSLVIVSGAAAFLLPVMPLLVPLLAHSHDWSSTNTGAVIGVFGAFNSVVAVMVLIRDTFRKPGLAAAVGVAVAGLGVVLLGSIDSFAASLIGSSIVGLGTGLFATHIGPLILRSTPKEYLARIQSLNLLVQSLPLFVANNVFGAASDWMGPSFAMVVCGFLSVLVGTYGLMNRPFRRAVFS
ncbi:MFS transporter [Streptomyces violaceusniger]